MGKHRTKLKILASILSVVRNNNGAKKTQIMYQAYLSYKLLLQYLYEITEIGFLKFENEYYKLTSKGEEFLEKFNEYNESRKIVNDQLHNVENKKSELEEMCCITNLIDKKSTYNQNKRV
jgi:predicted transcriptional regulator